MEEEEGEVNETLLKVSSDSETEKKWSKEMAWESAEEGSPSLRSAWGPSNAVFPSSLPLSLYRSHLVLRVRTITIPLTVSWKRYYSHYKVWDCLFFMGFYHTNKALSIVLAFLFTLTALESFSSRALAFRTASYFKSSTTVADNEEAIEKYCFCCYSSPMFATDLNFLNHEFINLTISFSSIK